MRRLAYLGSRYGGQALESAVQSTGVWKRIFMKYFGFLFLYFLINLENIKTAFEQNNIFKLLKIIFNNKF